MQTQMTGIRLPVAAGQIYPSDPVELRRFVMSVTPSNQEKRSAMGCLVPHDVYAFSGAVTGAVFGRVDLPRRFVILCPAHTAQGHPLGMMSRGVWRTPLGDVAIDEELAQELGNWYRNLREDDSVHRQEHSIEALLPFLQVLRPDFTFVPISVTLGSYEALAELGEAIANVLRRFKEPVLVISSSDMNHYDSAPIGREKDQRVIEKILALNTQGIVEAVNQHKVSMCGYAATVAMTSAALWLGASKGDLVRYATTADATGNPEAVVGYAGIILHA